MDAITVTYSCETKDGGTGFGCDRIVCTNPVDAEAVFDAICEHPERFDFAPIEPGQKRLVQWHNTTRYLD